MVVNESGNLLGVVSNGDILRWLTEKKHPNLISDISDVMNKSYLYITDNSSKEEIKNKVTKSKFFTTC